MSKEKKKRLFNWVIGSGLVLVCVLFFVIACSNTPHIVTNYGSSPQMTTIPGQLNVAVLPFRNATGLGGVGLRVSDEFTVHLLKNENLVILERTRIDDVMKELELADNEAIEGETAMRIGKMLNADAVLIGTVYRWQPYWNGERYPEVGLSARLVMVETGQTLWAGSDNFRGNDYAVQLLVPPAERWKLKRDVRYLSRVLCRELARTIGS